MRNITYIMVVIMGFAFFACNNTATQSAKQTTEITNGIATSTFKVWGNCDMCKETIEGSLKTNGITKADWNVETKMISVSYDTSKITLDGIQKNIASVGYDTEKYAGDAKVYNELPECCQYERRK